MFIWSSSSNMSIFSLAVRFSVASRENIHGCPNVARPIITASTPYFSKALSASSSDFMSPLPMIGIS